MEYSRTRTYPRAERYDSFIINQSDWCIRLVTHNLRCRSLMATPLICASVTKVSIFLNIHLLSSPVNFDDRPASCVACVYSFFTFLYSNNNNANNQYTIYISSRSFCTAGYQMRYLTSWPLRISRLHLLILLCVSLLVPAGMVALSSPTAVSSNW